ncbi:class I SAM-dependent methyltransferase [candidate division KSB1 bacterium]|nr:class I SAM-dependent methyltransferase [candidate division KSB1 bacterium]
MPQYLQTTYDLTDPTLVATIDDLPLWSAPFGLKLLDTVKYRSDMNVLDIGCGTGFPMIELANRLGDSCHIYGIDPWEKALERIRLKIQTQQLRNTVAVKCLAEKMPFQDNSFHLLVSNNGMNNVNDTEVALQECSRVACAGAQMVLTVNLPGTMKEFYSIFEEVLAAQGKFSAIAEMHNHIFDKRKPLYQTIDMMQQAGFQINSVDDDEFQLRFVDGSAMLNHYLIKLAFLTPWKNMLAATDQQPIFNILENKLNQLAAHEDGLYLAIPYVCIDCENRK